MSKKLLTTFDEILKEWGHNILLQRVLNPHADYERPRYGNTFEKHTVRRTYPGTRALGHVVDYAIEGMLHDFEIIYYFRHDVDPISGDRIYESHDYLGNRTKTEVFIIDLAMPMRGVGGHVVFWVAGATKEDVTIRSKG